MKFFNFKNEEETKLWVKDWIKGFSPWQIILLSGPMGAGKTHIVRWVCESLGVKEVQSPSFAIHQSYQLGSSAVPYSVEHFDLFRLKNEFELDSTGFWDILEEKRGWVFIEWPEKIPEAQWNKSWPLIRVALEITSSGGRKISYH